MRTLPPHHVAGAVTLALLFCLNGVARAAGEVKLDAKDNHVDVTIDGQPFTQYYFAAEGDRPYVRPFLFPVRAADGTVVTSDQLSGGGDHPHHRSLYVAHGDVNGADHWSLNGKPSPPKQRHVKFTKVDGDTLVHELEWEAKDGQSTLLKETRTLRFFALDEGSRGIDFTSTFEPLIDEVTFGDTKEAGLCAVRVAKDISANSTLTNARGQVGEKEAWGKPAEWCDLSGQVDGKPYGVAILDHPDNPRHPTRWHARGYGLMTANCFGIHDFDKVEKGAGNMTLKKGDKPVTFRYRVVIHQGDVAAAKVAEKFKAFAEEAQTAGAE